MRNLWTLIVVAVASGCASSGSALSDADFAALVTRTIRVDDDFEGAKIVLEQRGFRCGWIIVDPVPPTPSPPPTEISCQLDDLQHFQGCVQRVRVLREAGRVSQIQLELTRFSQFPRKGSCIAR